MIKKNFPRKIPYKRIKNIDYCILDEFKKNRILFTAEHAQTSVIKTPEYGNKSYISLGDKNTDKLAMMMAHRLQSGFMIPRFSRIDADPCRPINTLGKNERILVKVFGLNEKKYFLIHRNKNYAPLLSEYHSIIEKLNPSAIVSVHGMGPQKHPPDILLGFGRGYRIIGGRKNALRFKEFFIQKVVDALARLKIENNLNIKISKWLFTGEKNYILFRHVIQHNKESKKKRFGMHVEFNSRGRIIDRNFIRKDYQIASQLLADAVLEWLNHTKTYYFMK